MMTILPRQIPAMLALARQMNKPLMLWSPPGIGKTQMITSYAADAGMGLKSLLLSTKTPADLGGLCALDHATKTTVFYMPEFFPRDEASIGLIFFDELSSADDPVRVAAYSIIQERRQGDYHLPDGWQIVAAGNRPEDGCPAFDMGRAMNDRFLHVLVAASATDWLDWATSAGIDATVSGFISRNPHRLMPTDAEIQSGNTVLPSPRSWEGVSRACQATNDEELLQIAVAGLVGEIGANEFLAFRQVVASVATVGTILETPVDDLGDVIPTTVGGLYTLMYAFVSVVEKRNVKAMFDVLGAFEALMSTRKFEALPMLDVQSLGMGMVIKKMLSQKGAAVIEISNHPAFRRYREREKNAA